MDAQNLTPAKTLASKGRTPFPGETDAYRKARESLLAEEIEFRRHMTRLVEQRRTLPPGPVIEKDYRFKDANGEEVGLIDLFGKHDTLVSYFWMFGPQRERPCPMCTNWLGAVNGNAADIKQRVALKVLGRSPVERQLAFAAERGWRTSISCRPSATIMRAISACCRRTARSGRLSSSTAATATRCGCSGRAR